jgi:hypothetical protein
VSINGLGLNTRFSPPDLAKAQEGENRTDDDNQANNINDGIH